jgi:DNA-binding NarL/FixJ family response regulator
MMLDRLRRLGGVVVLVVSDDHHAERRLIELLADQGCVIRCAGPKQSLDLEISCDIGVIAVHRLHGWTSGVVSALRESRSVCATLTLLSVGGPDEITQSLRDGAVDCLVDPASTEVLLEGLSNTLACTYTWRRRVADATASQRSHTTLIAAARHRAFEPMREMPSDIEAGQSIDMVVDRLANQGQLTSREREVLYWLLQGHRYDDIATVLGVTARTAKFHAANLLRKLDLDSRHDLTRIVTQRFST